MPSALQDEMKSDVLKLRKVEKNENSIDKEKINSSKAKPDNQTKKTMTQKKKNNIQNLKKKGKISSTFVTSGLDRSITQLFKERKHLLHSKEPSLFHVENLTHAYPSLEDDRMVQQLYCRQEKGKAGRNLSIIVVVDGGWPWDEKEFAGDSWVYDGLFYLFVIRRV